MELHADPTHPSPSWSEEAGSWETPSPNDDGQNGSSRPPRLRLRIPRSRSWSRNRTPTDESLLNDVTPLPSPQLSTEETQGIFRLYNGQSPPMSAVSRAPSMRSKPPNLSLGREEEGKTVVGKPSLDNLLGDTLGERSLDKRIVSEYKPVSLSAKPGVGTESPVQTVQPVQNAPVQIVISKRTSPKKSSPLSLHLPDKTAEATLAKFQIRPPYGRSNSSGSQISINRMKRESHIAAKFDNLKNNAVSLMKDKPEKEFPRVYEAYDTSRRKSVWTEVKLLGRGAFSRVVLGTPALRHVKPEFQTQAATSNFLVAIKIIELGTAGSPARERVEASLRREVDILKSVQHPSLIRIHGFNMDKAKAIMVLPYCSGGDLFDLVSKVRSRLSPGLVRRVFAETVQAVAYLHSHNIVHRDIKLENVLLNVPVERLISLGRRDISLYRQPLITVTDLGLSRRIDPANPALTTRCGSEDYVPPEILMGQPYDGRQTDSWALGVLLYAIMEGRLPFDTPKNVGGGRTLRRTAHRIARVEWSWILFKDDDYDKEWDGGKAIVEGCLQRRDKRLCAHDIVWDPWIAGVVPVLNDRGGSDVSSIFK